MTSNPLDRGDRHQRKLYVAFEHHERVRNPVDHQTDIVIPEDPGLAHAFSLFWREVPGEEFYFGVGPEAICGTRIHARTAQLFPADDPDACPDCADIVRTGRSRRRPPRAPGRWPCGVRLWIASEDDQEGDDGDGEGGGGWVYCNKPRSHAEEHHAPSGETWETGHEADYTPAPDGFV